MKRINILLAVVGLLNMPAIAQSQYDGAPMENNPTLSKKTSRTRKALSRNIQNQKTIGKIWIFYT